MADKEDKLVSDSKYSFLWHNCLVAISLGNMALWYIISRRASVDNPHVWLSFIYTMVCAYRSFFPRIDLERWVLYDTMLSSVFFGRSGATMAEISFAVQLALQVQSLGINNVSVNFIVPMLTIAQVFCWSGVVLRNNFYHIIEESLWAVAAIIIAANLSHYYITGDPAAVSQQSTALIVSLIALAAYIVYMIFVDVPMYIHKYRTGPMKDRLSLFAGIKHALFVRVKKTSWSLHWQKESYWLTPYFSCAVWASIYFMASWKPHHQ